MASRRVYTPEDKARVAVILRGNEGNLKRTARQCNIPVMTLKGWRDDWEKNGFPEEMEAVLPAVKREVLDDFKAIVSLSTSQLIEKLQAGTVPSRELSWIALNFTDKIRLIEGQPTQRTEVQQGAIPSAKELAQELLALAERSVAAAKQRDEEIEDAVWEQVEVKALPAA